MAKITTKMSGGLEKYIAELVAANGAGVRVGALAGATYIDGPLAGESVAVNLARHEFGAEVKKEARDATVYFKKNKDGSVGNLFVKKDKSDFAQDVNIGAHTFKIPARAPIRTTMFKKEIEWRREILSYLKAYSSVEGIDFKAALTEVGDIMAQDIQDAFTNGLLPPLKPSTIKQKIKKGYGAHAGLAVVLTGQAQRSITAEYIEGQK